MSKAKGLFLKIVTSRLHQADAVQKAFQTKFAEDPAYAMAWADNTFDAAAVFAVASEVVAALELPNTTFAGIRAHIGENVLRRARNPEHSTSTCSNLMSVCATKAWADLFEHAERVADRVGPEAA